MVLFIASCDSWMLRCAALHHFGLSSSNSRCSSALSTTISSIVHRQAHFGSQMVLISLVCGARLRVRPEADVKQHVRRRRKRKREKAAKQAEIDSLGQQAGTAEAASRTELIASTSSTDVDATDEIAPWQVDIDCEACKKLARSCKVYFHVHQSRAACSTAYDGEIMPHAHGRAACLVCR